MSLKPVYDNILVDPIEQEDVTKSGLIIPETAKEKPSTGKVLAIGSGQIVDGDVIPIEVKVGDTVLFMKNAGIEVKDEKLDKNLLLLKANNVLCIIE